ncbi:MAG TPA: hypothetical protein DCZ95_00420 [Verrucomicrobia bacterium]|nr:MAG: hypothetical protein A2X46_03555 [Lentisphaerae bacterium GWF2_57_35]HBA82533.1 hypothetical protein [Verrucomicrobiota bacterium]
MKKKQKPRRASRSAATRGSPFPNRIVLGVGYPWAMRTGPYHEVAMRDDFIGGRNKQLKWPKALWSPDVPQRDQRTCPPLC